MEKFNSDDSMISLEWWEVDYMMACKLFKKDNPDYNVDRGISMLADIDRFYTVQAIMEKLAAYATRGNENAISALDNWYMHTHSEDSYLPEDSTQQVQWIRTVAQNGNPVAQNELAYLYYNGKHVDQNYNTAARWSAMAAAESAQAAYNFAEVYLTGKTTEIDECEASEPLYYAARYDCKPAQEWLQRTAERGLANAQFYLGMLVVQGQGAYEQDIETGLSWLHKAADQDFLYAINSLAMFYDNGKLIPQDLPKCIALLQRGVELGDMDAQDMLGMMYDEGKGVKQDHTRAVQLYEQSALQGEVSAMIRLAHHYLQGLGIPKDQSKAENWFRIAVSRGSYDGMLGLSMIHQENGEFEKAVDGYVEALGNIENLEFFNDDNPEYWLEEVNVKMSPEYMSWGIKLSSYVEDEEKPEIHTYAQLLEAATQGDAMAQHDIGYHYYWGGENYEQDIQKAVHWFELAANNGHAQSAYNLGVLYASGDISSPDFETACQWFRKAMELLQCRPVY